MDTSNKCQVRPCAARGSLAKLLRFNVPTSPQVSHDIVITNADAVNLAAWLVAIADPKREAFDRLWKEINGQ